MVIEVDIFTRCILWMASLCAMWGGACPSTAAQQVAQAQTVVPAAAVPATGTAYALLTAPTSASPPVPTPRPAPHYVFPLRADAYQYGPYHHDYPATDIFCAVGSEYLATTDGVIDFVNAQDLWSPASDDPALRGGIMIAMVGDDGVRYYGSHLSGVAAGIEVGTRVAAGDLLGWTGKSGNAQSTPPHLHYGISRPTTPDDWRTRRGELSPYPYLQAWERGEQLAPDLSLRAP